MYKTIDIDRNKLTPTDVPFPGLETLNASILIPNTANRFALKNWV